MALSVNRSNDGPIETADVKVDGVTVVLVTHNKKTKKTDVVVPVTEEKVNIIPKEPQGNVPAKSKA